MNVTELQQLPLDQMVKNVSANVLAEVVLAIIRGSKDSMEKLPDELQAHIQTGIAAAYAKGLDAGRKAQALELETAMNKVNGNG